MPFVSAHAARVAEVNCWYGRQFALLKACFGESWPLHERELDDLLQKELRQRLKRKIVGAGLDR